MHRDAASDAIQWRGDRVRAGRAAAGAHRAVRPQHRRRRGAGGRADGGASRPDHLRHGRHQHRCRAAAERRSAGWPARRWCTAIRSRRRCSTSTRSAPAAAPSPIVDSGGLLKVGPRSAGADPGPVCYGRGNTEPTVTDANVVLQTLNPTHLLGGRMAVRQDLARQRHRRIGGATGAGGDGDRSGHHFGRNREHGAGHPGDQRAARP